MDVLSKLNAKAGIELKKDLEYINSSGEKIFKFNEDNALISSASSVEIYSTEYINIDSNKVDIKGNEIGIQFNGDSRGPKIEFNTEIIISNALSGFKLDTTINDDSDFPGTNVNCPALQVIAGGPDTMGLTKPVTSVIDLVSVPQRPNPEEAWSLSSNIHIEPLQIDIYAGEAYTGSMLSMTADDIVNEARESYSILALRGTGEGKFEVLDKVTDIQSNNSITLTTKSLEKNCTDKRNSVFELSRHSARLTTTEFSVSSSSMISLNTDQYSHVMFNFSDGENTEFIEMSSSGIAISNCTSNGRQSFVTSNVENFKIFKMTQAEYDALAACSGPNPNALYIIVEGSC